MFVDNVNKVYLNEYILKVKFLNLCVIGEIFFLIENGYEKAVDFYKKQNNFKVVIDNRIKDFVVDSKGIIIVDVILM